jgi:hypothetical protein
VKGEDTRQRELVTHRVFDTQREQRRIFAQSEGGENKQCSKRKNNSAARFFLWRPYHQQRLYKFSGGLYSQGQAVQQQIRAIQAIANSCTAVGRSYSCGQQIRAENFLQQGQNSQVFFCCNLFLFSVGYFPS